MTILPRLIAEVLNHEYAGSSGWHARVAGSICALLASDGVIEAMAWAHMIDRMATLDAWTSARPAQAEAMRLHMRAAVAAVVGPTAGEETER